MRFNDEFVGESHFLMSSLNLSPALEGESRQETVCSYYITNDSGRQHRFEHPSLFVRHLAD
jgi:hypothetical protein